MFKKRVRVSNIKDPDQFFEEDFWVNTGALYSFVLEDYLEKIKAEPVVHRDLVFADRRRERRPLGFCNFVPKEALYFCLEPQL